MIFCFQMSFISILKKIGSVALGIEHVAAPIAEAVLPAYAGIIAGLDGLVLKTQASILTTEANNPSDGQGGLKAPAVQADVKSYIETLRAGLALAGKGLEYDDADLQDAINAQVAAYNAFGKLKASFKTPDLPK